MMTKESHPSYTESQLRAVESSSLNLSEDMNFDIDNETVSYSQPYDSFSSPTKPILMDTVDWANSQPVALKSLLSEVRKRPGPRERGPINYDPTWPTSDNSFDHVSSTSRGPLEVKSRPLRRTNSNARARLGPEAASTSSNPPPAPDGDFWCKDRLTILVACQNVSERMDENAFALAAQVHKSVPPQASFKRKAQGSCLFGTAKSKRASSTSYPVIHDRESISRWEKSKQRIGPLSEAMPAGTNRQRLASAPVVARTLQRAASSSSSSGPSTDLSSSESPDTSVMDMDIDADLHDETPPTSLPVSVTRPPQPRPPIHSTSISTVTNTSGRPAPPPHPQIHLHPLLTQKQQKPKLDPLNTFAQNAKPPPPLPPPQGALLSQSIRPPPLGMRRAHTAPVTTATHALPTHQRAFKPPLLSQPVRIQPQHRPNAEVNLRLHMPKGRVPSPEPEPEPEPETNGDADSSFGDISLGVDDDELELTMRQYDWLLGATSRLFLL